MYNTTNKIYDILNNIKGFDVAMECPKDGRILVRYRDKAFILTLEELDVDTNKLSFDEIAVNHFFKENV